MQRLLVIALSVYLATAISSISVGADDVPGLRRMIDAPRTKQAAMPPSTSAQTLDVIQLSGGAVRGQLQDRLGRPIANAHVVVAKPLGKVASAKTNARGQFVLARVPKGTLSLQIGKYSHTLRVWEKSQAPPRAKQQVLVVVGDVVRAQHCDGGPNCTGCATCGPCDAGFEGHFGGVFQRLLRNPWLVGAGTAAAIAVPLATTDDDVRDGDVLPDGS